MAKQNKSNKSSSQHDRSGEQAIKNEDQLTESSQPSASNLGCSPPSSEAISSPEAASTSTLVMAPSDDSPEKGPAEEEEDGNDAAQFELYLAQKGVTGEDTPPSTSTPTSKLARARNFTVALTAVDDPATTAGVAAEINGSRLGLTCDLDAPTSGMVRRGEDSLTYLNKDQFYGLSLRYEPGHCEDEEDEPEPVVASVIMLQFRDRKEPQEAVAHWEFWHARQHSPQMRLIDVDAKASAGLLPAPNGGEEGGESVAEIAHNAVLVKWAPYKGANVMLAIRCLSTDFSSQKGVKGIPLQLQVDTYRSVDAGRGVWDRAFCQIKTFCDKGAERKAREEEKRIGRHGETSTFLMPVQQRTVLKRGLDLATEPVLYAPQVASTEANTHSDSSSFPSKDVLALPPDARVRHRADAAAAGRPSGMPYSLESMPVVGGQRSPEDSLSTGQGSEGGRSRRARSRVASGSQMHHHMHHSGYAVNAPRVLIYAKQENEEVYTPLHVVPPTVQGLIRAISSKYQIDSVDIRFAFRETARGVVVKIDDDMIRYYCNGDVFHMKVLATEETASGHVFYDVVFSDPPVQPDGDGRAGSPPPPKRMANGNLNAHEGNNNGEEDNKVNQASSP